MLFKPSRVEVVLVCKGRPQPVYPHARLPCRTETLDHRYRLSFMPAALQHGFGQAAQVRLFQDDPPLLLTRVSVGGPLPGQVEEIQVTPGKGRAVCVAVQRVFCGAFIQMGLRGGAPVDQPRHTRLPRLVGAQI